jgi:hypothetical protein
MVGDSGSYRNCEACRSRDDSDNHLNFDGMRVGR